MCFGEAPPPSDRLRDQLFDQAKWRREEKQWAARSGLKDMLAADPTAAVGAEIMRDPYYGVLNTGLLPPSRLLMGRTRFNVVNPTVSISPSIFDDPQQTAATMAHEFGHVGSQAQRWAGSRVGLDLFEDVNEELRQRTVDERIRPESLKEDARLGRNFHLRDESDPDGTMRRVQALQAVLDSLSLQSGAKARREKEFQSERRWLRKHGD